MRRFEGKVAIVTGGAGGIGRGVVQRLSDEGASVLVADIAGDAAVAFAAELQAAGRAVVGRAVDVANEDEVAGMIAAAVSEFGGLDVLHNNAALTDAAAMAQDDLIENIDADMWDAALRVNLRGYMLGVKHAVPRMLERGGGAIVNTSSGTGITAEVTRPAYGTSKAAVIGFTRNVATQYGKRRIRCNAIAPGIILTPAVANNIPAEFIERYKAHHLTPYLGQPSDIAAAVAFLASDDARFVTGVTIPVDGGFSSHTASYADEAAAAGRG